MRKFPLLLTASVTVSALLAGSLSELAAEEATKGAIWKLSDEDSTVYLAGSVHLLREKDLPVPQIFEEVYEDSDEMVFEIDMGTMFDPATAMEVQKLGTLPEGETLPDKLDHETMTLVRDYLTSRGLPEGLFDRFTPGMVYLTLSSLEATRNGARPDLGLEAQFYTKCKKDGKPSRGLETTKFQMSRFAAFTPEEIEKLLQKSLEDIDDTAKVLDTMIESWKSGDMEALGKLVVEETAPTPRVRKLLLTDRNKNWVPEVEQALAGTKNVMFLVGAAHLIGPESVVDLLEKNGHSVKQVELSEIE